MAEFVHAHNLIVRRLVTESGGRVFKSLGDGLAAVFAAPHDAIAAAVAAQRELLSEERPALVRMGLNSGFAELIDDDYMGAAVNRVARITDLGHGGQILTSSATLALAADLLPAGVTGRSLGVFALKGHSRLEEVVQLEADGLRRDFPPLRSAPTEPSRPAHNLLELDREFIGRRREVESLSARLQDRSQRLITLLGFGGIGKTTLANRCAWSSLSRFPDGVWWVDCESLESRDQVIVAIATALGERLDGAEAEVRLADVISGRRMLLVLDCFEAITHHAGVLDRLLRRCANLQMLVTSRVVLGIAQEHEFELRGLGEGLRRGALKDGIELFAATASRVDPYFAITRSSRKQVSGIIRSVEGIPLAIVLAAGRLRHMTLEEIALRVESSVLDAVRSVSTAQGRHSNLRRVIETSFDLLPQEDRRVASDLSVFDGGFYVTDALAVVGGGEALADAIGRLRDSSLLTADRRQDGMRYRALDSVREYLSGAIEPTHLEKLETAHAQHFTTAAIAIRSAYKVGDWVSVSSRLSLEGANLRRAARTAIRAKETTLIRRLAFALCRLYLEAGLHSDFEELARAADETLGDREVGPDLDLKVELLGLRGVAARRAGDNGQAVRLWTQRAELCESDGRFDLCAESWLDVLNLQLECESGGFAEPLARFFAVVPRVKDPGIRAAGAVFQAKLALLEGQVAQALSIAEDIESCWQFDVPTDDVFYVLRSLSELYRGTGNSERAEWASLTMLKLALDGGFKHLVARSILELAHARVAMGNPELAYLPLVAALQVPPAVSAAVAKEALRLKEQLRGSAVYDQLHTTDGGPGWLAIAGELASVEPIG